MAMEEMLAKRVMPHSNDAERAVIGSMLMNREVIPAIMEVITEDDFYAKQFGLLYRAIVELYNEGKPVDEVTLRERASLLEAPPEITGDEFLAELVASVPLSQNAQEYARIIADKAMLRRLINVTEQVTNNCYAENDKLEVIMDEAEKDIFRVLQKRSGKDFYEIGDVVVKVLNQINEVSRQKGAVTGIASGFLDLDYKTAGFQRSDLILIAARPSMGKTAFALNIAQYVATHSDETALVFSLEMSADQLVKRILAMESRVDAQLIRNGNLSVADWGNLMEGAGVVGGAHLLIDDTPGISVGELRSKCRKAKLERKLGIVLIDYLQLMTAGSKRIESRQQEVSEISRSLKALARELNVPVIALSQLSRAVEQRPDHRPQMSDLRESGAIEQDADVVMFLYREDYYDHDTERKNIAEVIIAKQRNGPTGTVELVWLPQYTKFANMAQEVPGDGA